MYTERGAANTSARGAQCADVDILSEEGTKSRGRMRRVEQPLATCWRQKHEVLVSTETRGSCCAPLQRRDDCVRAACHTDAGRPLLHGLHRVLDLKQASLRRKRCHIRVVHVLEHLVPFLSLNSYSPNLLISPFLSP